MSKKSHPSGPLSRKCRTSVAAGRPAMLEALEPRLLLSLIAHLELNETSGSTAADTVSDHDGTRIGGTVWDDARIGNGAYIDGSGDRIDVANSDDFNFGASDSFTISTWVRDDDSGGFTVALIRGGTLATGLGYGGNSAGPGFFMGRYTTDGTYMFTLSDGSHGAYAIYSPPPSDGYHLLTMVGDRSTDELRCYADGVLFATKDISSIGSLDGGADVMQIGGTTAGKNWTGMIDDVRVYDHALSTSDVEDLYEDAPTWVSIHADDAIATEDEGDTATFRVLRTGTLSGAITVNYSVSGTATSADYSETLGGTVTIADGESYANIIITPVDDAADDGESVILTLASGTGYDVSDIDEATAVIYDEADLLAHWTMDETSGATASDSSGNDFDATRYGDTGWTDGWINNGAYLDGLNDYMTVADAAGLDFGEDQSFTVSAWLRDDRVGSQAAVVAKGSLRAHFGVSNEGAGWGMGRYANLFVFGVTDGVTAEYYATSGLVFDSGFHLMTMVVDRDAQYLNCYMDGDLKSQVDISSVGSLASFSEALYIGMGNYTIEGVIDDVRIYTYALDGTDVEDLYEATLPTVSIVTTDGVAVEDSANTANFRIFRTGGNGEMTINYTVSGTATSADYSETLSGTATIAAGNAYVDITITPVDDASPDDGETLILTLADGTGYAVGDADEATVTIYDTDHLLAHLTMDETSGSAADDSVGDHDGTRIGGTVWDDGRIDNGAYFDGAGDYIDVANSDDFNFGASDSFTISTWVRDDDSAGFTVALIRGGTSAVGLGYGGNSAGPGFFMGRYAVENAYMFSLSDGTYGTSAVCNPSLNDGYHLLTMVGDRSTDELRCYADGVLFATKDISSIGSLDGGADVLEIGGTTAGKNWTGMIDDVRVYNYALTDADVSALYDDAPTWITIYADDAIASEEAVGTDAAVFRVLRTGSIGDAVTVNYSVSGTAAVGDYSETLGGTVSLGIGQREAEITITPVADGTVDNGETVTVTLTSGTGYDISGLDDAMAVIYDEAGLLAHWKMDETSGSTAADDTGNGFTATRSGDTGWDYGRINNGAYLDGSNDYMTVADSIGLDFGGDQSFTVSAWVRDDRVGSSVAVIAKGNLNAQYGATNEGTGWAMGRYSNSYVFGVTDGITAEFYTSANIAFDSGFHLMTMVVDRGADVLRSFVDGELLGQNDISSVGSLASFYETLSVGTGIHTMEGVIDDMRIYNCALTTTQVAALYADTSLVVAIEALDATASETGSEPATFRITRDGSTAEALEVDYSLSGTAAGADYSETLSGTVTIAAGESYADITITPVDDASNEGDETVIATLTPSSADYAILSTASATATVTIGDSDNVSDPQVVIGITDSEASEDGNDPATFRIYRSGATTSDLAVNYSVSGTAEGDDYSETLSGTVTITAGNSYADITITPVTDENFEYPEVLVLTLAEDANYTIGLSDEASAIIYDIPFSAQLNPTGNPIGGGIGYSDIVDIGDADYVVDTAAGLVDALSSATYGDIIYVEDDAEIDLTGYIADTSYNALFIPAGVTLASGRGNDGSMGALIYTTDEWDDGNRVAMLGTSGDDIRVTGPAGYALEYATDDKYASGIRCSTNTGNRNHKNIEIDNCEIYDWTMAGVYVMYGEGVNIHHNHIHTNIGEGYQYGIWFGATPARDAEWAATAEANLFDVNRHDIGSGCHWPWAARYNIFGPNQYLQILDRHGGVSLDTWIENNWNQADGWIEFRCGFISDYGGTVYYNNNWTPKEEVGPGTAAATMAIYGDGTYFDTEASGNTFSFDEHDAPYTPVSATAVTYLSTPMTVSFNSSESYDPEGLDILSHEWWFGDSESNQGEMSFEDNPTYTYSDPGLYEVIHYAYNEYGVPGYDKTDVIVRPEEGGYWLSAWVRGAGAANIPTDNAYKQILIDDEVVWEDDVYGDDGWQHAVVDISEYVTAGIGARLSFRLVSDGGYYAAMGVDNVYIFGGDVGDSHLSNAMVWDVYDPDDSSVNWQVNIASRAGRLSTEGARFLTWGTAGTAEVYQMVPIGKALQPMVTDDFESGDGTGGENWDANWVLTGSAAVTSSGAPYGGSYHLLLTGSSGVASRAADLSDVIGDVSLKFQYTADSFEAGEEVSVEIYDGSNWQEVMVIEDGDDDGEYHLTSIDLSGYSLTEDFQVRFTASLADASDYFYVDDLVIA